MQVSSLESSRLRLRAYGPDDFEAFARLNADGAVRQHVGQPLSRAKARRVFDTFIAGRSSSHQEVWAVVRIDTGDYIGHCWFVFRDAADCPELGFLLAVDSWGHGYGTEVARTLIDYAFSQAGYARVIATVDPEHTAAIRLLEGVGMRREPDRTDDQGIYFVYSMPNPNYSR